MMNDFKQGDKVKLSKRETADVKRVVLGHGQSPGGLFVSENGHEVFIPADQVLQVSEAEDLVIGDMDAQPLPRISAGFVNRDKVNKRFSKVD